MVHHAGPAAFAGRHSPDGKIKRRQSFALVESGGIVLLLGWLMAYTRLRDSRQQDAAHEASEEAKLERASSVCRHAGGVKVAARILLADILSAANEETWSTLLAKFPSEDNAAASAVAAAAVLASAPEAEDGNTLPWRPDNEYTSDVLFNVISLRSGLLGPGNDGSHACSPLSLPTSEGSSWVRGITSVWKRLVDEPDAFPPEFWQLFLQSSLTALGEKCVDRLA